MASIHYPDLTPNSCTLFTRTCVAGRAENTHLGVNELNNINLYLKTQQQQQQQQQKKQNIQFRGTSNCAH